jgi:hypothetical protein
MKPTISKRSDGYEVQVGPLIVGYLNFFEGIIYRLTGHIPEWCYTATSWFDPEVTGPVHFNVREEP